MSWSTVKPGVDFVLLLFFLSLWMGGEGEGLFLCVLRRSNFHISGPHHHRAAYTIDDFIAYASADVRPPYELS